MTPEQAKAFFESPVAQDVKIALAFLIDKTPTEKDNEIVKDAGSYTDVLAEFLKEVEALNPTDKEAIDAMMRVAKKGAALTETPWDDRILSVVDIIV